MTDARGLIGALAAMAFAPVVLLLMGFVAPACAGQRVALVIGNASYAHAPSLVNSLNDATDFGAALERLDFAVTRLPNSADVGHDSDGAPKAGLSSGHDVGRGRNLNRLPPGGRHVRGMTSRSI